MTTLLPDSFRSFGHIEFLYGRNVPLKVPGEEEERGGSLSPSRPPAAKTSDCFLFLSEFVSSTGGGEGSSSGTEGGLPHLTYRSELSSGTQHPTWRLIPSTLTASAATCTRFTVEIRSPVAGNTHGSHARDPSHSIVCTSEDVARELRQGTVLVAQISVDTRRLRYVGASVAATDHAVATATMPSSPQRMSGGQPRQQREGSEQCGSPFCGDPGNDFCVYFACTDGIFALPRERCSPTAAPLVLTPRRARTDAVEWSRSPGGCGTYIAGTDGGREAGGGLSPPYSQGSAADFSWQMSIGDVRALAAASLSWRYLLDITTARREEALARIDATAEERKVQVQAEVAAAAAQAALSEARESLTLASLERERLQAAIQERQLLLHRQEEQIEALQAAQHTRGLPETVKDDTAAHRREELERANVRARLARAQHARVAELARLYPVVLSSQYAAPLQDMRNAKDSVAGHVLPVFLADRGGGSGRGGGGGGAGGGRAEVGGRVLLSFPEDGDADIAASIPGLVASSTEDLFEEATAMGHVAHLLTTLSVLYGCPLPHPFLVAGSHSRVLVRADITPQQAAAPSVSGPDDAKLPLSCQRAAERPLLRAAVTLVLRNCVALARVMGKDEESVLSQGLRLGAVLHYLLTTES